MAQVTRIRGEGGSIVGEKRPATGEWEIQVRVTANADHAWWEILNDKIRRADKHQMSGIPVTVKEVEREQRIVFRAAKDQIQEQLTWIDQLIYLTNDERSAKETEDAQAAKEWHEQQHTEEADRAEIQDWLNRM